MAFNCNTNEQSTACGTYVVEYLGNLEYVNRGLLEIINTIILPDETRNGTLIAPYDITDENCNCFSICLEGKVTNCVSIEEATVFNCATWNTIKNLLLNQSTEAEDDGGYLNVLSQTIRCLLRMFTNGNFGFAAQIERFLCLVDSLIIRLTSVSCNSNCPEIVGDLLCLLMQILTRLISIIAKVSTLAYYYDCATTTNISTSNRTITTFFECMACDFINDLCELEKLVADLSAIVVGFATCDMQRCTPCYTAPSAPRKVRNVCCSSPQGGCGPCGSVAAMQSPYQSQSVCGCSHKK